MVAAWQAGVGGSSNRSVRVKSVTLEGWAVSRNASNMSGQSIERADMRATIDGATKIARPWALFSYAPAPKISLRVAPR